MIKLIMRKKSLLETNPYLKDPELRAALIERFVATSTAIEGVHIKIPKTLPETDKEDAGDCGCTSTSKRANCPRPLLCLDNFGNASPCVEVGSNWDSGRWDVE